MDVVNRTQSAACPSSHARRLEADDGRAATVVSDRSPARVTGEPSASDEPVEGDPVVGPGREGHRGRNTKLVAWARLASGRPAAVVTDPATTGSRGARPPGPSRPRVVEPQAERGREGCAVARDGRGLDPARRRGPRHERLGPRPRHRPAEAAGFYCDDVIGAGHWVPGTYHVVTVNPGALAASGRPMSSVVRAAFVTRAATTGRIETTTAAGDSASLATAFRLTFDHPVAAKDLEAAIRVTPSVAGSVTAAAGRPDASLAQATSFVFVPSAALAAATDYRITLDGLVDADGSPVTLAGDLSLTTVAAPSVVRFRPASGATKVDRHAALSVRFTTSMDHRTTRAAFSVTAGGKPVAGTIQFAESSTVLVFHPSKALPASAKVVVTRRPRRHVAARRPARQGGQRHRDDRRGPEAEGRRRRRTGRPPPPTRRSRSRRRAAARSAAAAGARSRPTTCA